MIILRFDNRKTETPFLCFLFGGFWIFGTQLCRIRHNAYRAHCAWYTQPMFSAFCLRCDETERLLSVHNLRSLAQSDLFSAPADV